MARRVVTRDDVAWRLDAAQPEERLTRVGGLDISFVETHQPAASPTAQPQAAPGAATSAAAAAPGAAAADPEAPLEDPEPAGPGVAALVVLSFPDMGVLYEDYEPVDLSIPYLPGFLGFRECDAYARLLRRVEGSPHQPQVLLVDGCGVLHPRGCGSACQVGVTCDYACVGVAKNLLAVDGLDRFAVRRQMQEAAAAATSAGQAGCSSSPATPAAAAQSTPAPPTARGPAAVADTHEDSSREAWTRRGNALRPSPASADTHCSRGSDACGGGVGGAAPTPADVRDVQIPLVGESGAVHGVALCPQTSRKPLFISVGHRLSLETAAELVRRCCVHRVPEPIRQADLRSRRWLRDGSVLAATGTG